VAAQFEFLQNDDVAYFLGEPSFWMVMTVTAAAGFLINVAIFLQIKVTTPLTNTISGTAKVCVRVWFRPCAPSCRAHDRPRRGSGDCVGQACVQTLLGWLIFQNYITALVRARGGARPSLRARAADTGCVWRVRWGAARTGRASCCRSAAAAGTRGFATGKWQSEACATMLCVRPAGGRRRGWCVCVF
jgi:hypothetical protein